MKAITKSLAALAFAMSASLWAATPVESARSVLNQEGPNLVEQLVAIGGESVPAAAAVMEQTARLRPASLTEVITALSQNMDARELADAGNLAVKALEDKPELQRLIIAQTRETLRIAYGACELEEEKSGHPAAEDIPNDQAISDSIQDLDLEECDDGGSALRIGEPASPS